VKFVGLSYLAAGIASESSVEPDITAADADRPGSCAICSPRQIASFENRFLSCCFAIVSAILPLFCNPILRRDVRLSTYIAHAHPELGRNGVAMPAGEGTGAEG